jgi:hypothetical protein
VNEDSGSRRLPRFRQRSLHTLGRRVGMAFRRRVLGRFVPVKQVRVIWIGDARCKRVTLPDSFAATQLARSLERFRAQPVFPALIAQSANELLLEFVEGRPFAEPLDAARCDQLAEFFAVLYAQDRHAVEPRSAGFVAALEQDVAFLTRAGVLEAAAQPELERAIAALTPAQVFVGHDYLDPIARNFVVTPAGRLVAIDVEDLLPSQLIGSGVAKAVLRTQGADRGRLLAGIRRATALDLEPVMPFVELAFLAGWTKRALLKGRARLVRPELFEPFRRRGVR